MSKLLLIAPTCDGKDIGEAWVAYQWVRRLALRHEVTLLTYNKRGKHPASAQLRGMRIVEWSEPPLLGRAERLNSMLKPGYIAFYFKARNWIRQALSRGETFDLAHQIVPVAMRYPSPVAGLGVPYLIGPVGGSLESLPGFESDGDSAPWYLGLRRIDRLRMRFDPLLRRTYEEASCIVGIAPYVGSFLAGLNIQRLEILSETGLEMLPDPVDRSNRDGPVRLLYVGRIVRTKGLRDAIRAMAHLNDLPLVLDVVGDGFDRTTCEELSARLGISDRVFFHGRLPRVEVDRFYQAADIFIFPSYREPGGNVVFEAMGWGLPLIVSDRGGPGSAVDDSCGVRIKPLEPQQFSTDLAAAIRNLATDQAARLALGNGARHRVAATALWDQKIKQMERHYRKVLGNKLSGSGIHSAEVDLGCSEMEMSS